ncbi:uncharacterized protein LACBIDRAFT_384346 [Laccaria bicolor S238N-H82]|uniref:Predicted protein n=1 Tax=Laccaria bicolor (strain S238N-H82 / ATCC MYA-4686) TaxID=486041 RepID=B0D317_LACBS|nr:uncharacterized protein LACBIDRAFT_384346 [Laccaria bicolor S238N-H82]EDR11197.1 predicted protein [Laccaria bicolor S238N-H82]|eukprot:XP_001878498.1 predicted protein [Laccaria bicolor S238N-H82]
MPRAGLVCLIFFFLCAGLASSAPVPERVSSNIESFAARYDHDLDVRFLDFDLLEGRDNLLDERDLDLLDDELYARNTAPHTEQLYRRTSIFTKIKQGFQKLGRKIKSGFQKAGAAIKKGFQKFGQKVKSGFQKAGAAIKTGFQKFGQKAKAGFQKAGAAIKKGFQTFGQKAKAGFQKAGKAIKKGFQKVGQFIKTTGAKIAKFGLKIVSAAAGVLGTVARFIPGIGTGLSAALKGVQKGTDAASNAIHANLGSKLEKGMKALNIIGDPIGAGIKAAAKGVAKKVKHH